MYKASITTQQSLQTRTKQECLILDVDSSRDVTLYKLPVATNLHDVNLERLARTSFSDKNIDFQNKSLRWWTKWDTGRTRMSPPASNPDLWPFDLCQGYVPLTLTFDRLTSKLVCESHLTHLRWETFIPNLGTLGLRVLELFAMYATDWRTDVQKQRLLPLTYGRGIINRWAC